MEDLRVKAGALRLTRRGAFDDDHMLIMAIFSILAFLFSVSLPFFTTLTTESDVDPTRFGPFLD